MSDLEWHPASEEYCETILELGQADVEVIQARVAERLGVTRPAVSGMIRRLGVAGLVQVTAGIIELTPAGRSLADRVVRRRRLAEQLLVDVLGLDPDDARHEAGKVGARHLGHRGGRARPPVRPGCHGRAPVLTRRGWGRRGLSRIRLACETDHARNRVDVTDTAKSDPAAGR